MTVKTQATREAPATLPAAGIVRVCGQCGALDREMPGPEDDPCRHFVQIEMRHLHKMRGLERAEDQADPIKRLRLKARGWRTVKCVCHGLPAVDRLRCMDCLNSNELAEKMDNEYRRDAARLERGPAEQNFYLILCD